MSTDIPRATALARIGTLALAAYLLLTAATIEGIDRDLFGVSSFDGRWLYIVSGILGIATVLVGSPRIALAWALAMTATTLGRAMSLWLNGSPTIAPRIAEIRGGFGWLLFWLLGSACVVTLEGSSTLRRAAS